MKKHRAYSGTTINITRSRDEIDWLLNEYGAMDVDVTIQRPEIWREDGDRKNPQNSEGGAIIAEFQWPRMSRSCRMKAEIADEVSDDPRTNIRPHIEQEMRIAGRSLYYRVKTLMETISSGDLSEMSALFPYFVLPGQGITVAEKPDSELEYLIESGRMRLPAQAGPDAHGHDITKRD